MVPISLICRCLLGLSLLIIPVAARAEEPVTVAEVQSGDQLRLEDGRLLRLANLEVPRPAQGTRPAQPLAAEATRALKTLLEGKAIRINPVGQGSDRQGRVLARVERAEDGLVIQTELLRQGWARARTFPDSADGAADLYAAEDEARAARRGLWADPWYAVRGPDGLAQDRGTVQIVRGTVRKAVRLSDKLMLNFGEDWHTDFSVKILSRDLKSFHKQDLDPMDFRGKLVEVRGFVEEEDGPMIRVNHPEQIRLVK